VGILRDRIPDNKYLRLKELAESQGVSVKLLQAGCGNVAYGFRIDPTLLDSAR
jgi:hypothetical protein